ncbi:N-alpha-acetyltransferase 50 [Kappamyces sp. JEL0680]|nr:N-alpha-acetyltransferase 50 [Kappamyces sp. JEL0680]
MFGNRDDRATWQDKKPQTAKLLPFSNFWPPSFSSRSASNASVKPIPPVFQKLADDPALEQDVLNERRAQGRKEAFSLAGYDFQLLTICQDNIGAFRDLNLALFPVIYHEKFYRDVLYNYPVPLSRIGWLVVLTAAYQNGRAVGAISCRKETKEGLVQAYIMTIGILEQYRRVGLGKRRDLRSGSHLLRRILQACDKDPTIDRVCLHVHVSNATALAFYARHGFEIDSRIDSYYEKHIGVDPPDAFLLKKSRL